MKQFITLFIAIITISYSNSQEQEVSIQEPLIATSKRPTTVENKIEKDTYTVKHKDYTLHFKIEKVDSKTAFLVMKVTLYNNSYYVSPHDIRDMKGKLKMDFGSYNDIAFNGKMIATPPFSPNKVDEPRVESDMHKFKELNGAIKETVTYKQPLIIKTNGDFYVIGRVRFVIEPRCTMEENPLKIIYKNGVFTFGDPKC